MMLTAARADGVDLFQHTFARTQKPQAPHQSHVRGAKPADRKHPKASGSEYGKQGAVLELSDDVRPKPLRIEPAVHLGKQGKIL